MSTKIAGLIINDSSHYLDHLAPFCALRGYPLIVCEPSLASLAQMYYPELQIVEERWTELKLPKTIVSCHPRPILQSAFPFTNMHTCWLPHGNSDKGWKSAVFEHLCHEQTVFVYGANMIDSIKKNDALSHLHIEQVGNFREQYFQKHKNFYRNLLQEKIPAHQTTTLLYAPTWEDTEDNCSFWKAFPLLADHLPEDYTLIVKPHPNTITAFSPELERLIGRYSYKKNIIWIIDFPPIYALTDRCDGYIGDMSSIGYDFLWRNCPMYFLNHQNRNRLSDRGLYLYQCGTELAPEEYKNLFTLDRQTRNQDKERFHKIRETIYCYTFN